MIKLNLKEKKELLKFIEEHIELKEFYGNKEIKDLYNDFKVTVKHIEKLPIEDEGKYQHSGDIYQVIMDEKITDMFIMLAWYRTGSYYSDYYYEYYKPELCERYEKVIVDWRVLKAEDECHFDY